MQTTIYPGGEDCKAPFRPASSNEATRGFEVSTYVHFSAVGGVSV
jgi:hypothetical protein